MPSEARFSARRRGRRSRRRTTQAAPPHGCSARGDERGVGRLPAPTGRRQPGQGHPRGSRTCGASGRVHRRWRPTVGAERIEQARRRAAPALVDVLTRVTPRHSVVEDASANCSAIWTPRSGAGPWRHCVVDAVQGQRTRSLRHGEIVDQQRGAAMPDERYVAEAPGFRCGDESGADSVGSDECWVFTAKTAVSSAGRVRCGVWSDCHRHGRQCRVDGPCHATSDVSHYVEQLFRKRDRDLLDSQGRDPPGRYDFIILERWSSTRCRPCQVGRRDAQPPIWMAASVTSLAAAPWTPRLHVRAGRRWRRRW